MASVRVYRLELSLRGRRTRSEIIDLPLESHEMPQQREDPNEQTRTTHPPHDRISNEVILDPKILPTVHPHSVVKEWPVERFGSDSIFFVGVWNESVV